MKKSKRTFGAITNESIHITEIPEVPEKEKRAESLFEEIMTENFLNLGREINL